MENKIQKMLANEPISTMISCIPEDEKGNPIMQLIIQSKYARKPEPSRIPEERRDSLATLFYKNSRKALEEIIPYRFLDREIIGYHEGEASMILPMKDCRGHKRCVSFETNGFKIYFNDFAIPIFKNTILKLSEQSKKDSFQFIKRKIESGESQHLHISMTPSYQNTRSRMCMQLSNKGKRCQDPTNALYYYTNFLSDGTIDSGDLENILELIEIFVQTYGEFGMIKEDDNECIGYNVGSLKITGIETVIEPLQKVYSLRKKEEE